MYSFKSMIFTKAINNSFFAYIKAYLILTTDKYGV